MIWHPKRDGQGPTTSTLQTTTRQEWGQAITSTRQRGTRVLDTKRVTRAGPPTRQRHNAHVQRQHQGT